MMITEKRIEQLREELVDQLELLDWVINAIAQTTHEIDEIQNIA